MRFQEFLKSVTIIEITPNGILVMDPTIGDTFEVNEEAIINQARTEMLDDYYVSMGAHRC